MIFMMRGTTCSGKDTFIEKHFKDAFQDGAIFSSDMFRKMLCGDVHVQKYNKQVFEMMHNIIESRLANKVAYTVYNATNLKMRDASNILELAKKYHTPVTIISIIPPELDELVRRNEERCEKTGFYIPKHVIEKHHKQYFECLGPFIKEAENNSHVKFVEIDQDYEVQREI